MIASTTAATTAAIVSMASAAVSAGVGVYAAMASAKQQQKQLEAQEEQARYQAEIEKRNQQIAENEASAKRYQGYEAMNAKRLETARLIGRQRAAMGASGAALDEGSTLDTVAETAAAGEMDAINLYNQGIDQAYRSQLDAWNYGQRAAGADASAEYYGSAAGSAMTGGYLNAAQAALGGISSMASTWGKMGSGETARLNYDPALQQYAQNRPAKVKI